jgi:AcrR family transcriptional regulator
MAKLDADRVRELHAATLEVLIEVGFDNLSMDLVATRAHASKATLYRHWPDKVALLVDALRCGSAERKPTTAPDTGSLRGDLHALVAEDAERDQSEGELITAVLHACQRDPALGEQLREHVLAAHHAVFDTVIAQAVARGEIAPDPPAARFAFVALAGPPLVRFVLEGHPADAEYERAYIDAVLLPALGVH